MKLFLQKNIVALSLILVAVVFVVIGVWRDEIAVVLRKAINICMECIGLG